MQGLAVTLVEGYNDLRKLGLDALPNNVLETCQSSHVAHTSNTLKKL